MKQMPHWLRKTSLILFGAFIVLAAVTYNVAAHFGGANHRSHSNIIISNQVPVEQTAAKPNVDNTDKEVDCAKAKCIALTFDDGPGDYTPKLLDILEERKVKATFFVWGGKYDGKALLQREAKAGMEIGNHTWHHKDLTSLTASEIRWEINETADSIEQAIGRRPNLIRPPFGYHNAQARQAAKKAGEAIILWDVDPEDWRHKSKQHIIEFLAENAKPDGIVDLHERKITVQALPKIIDRLRGQDYTFVTVSQLLGGDLKPGQVYGAE